MNKPLGIPACPDSGGAVAEARCSIVLLSQKNAAVLGSSLPLGEVCKGTARCCCTIFAQKRLPISSWAGICRRGFLVWKGPAVREVFGAGGPSQLEPRRVAQLWCAAEVCRNSSTSRFRAGLAFERPTPTELGARDRQNLGLGSPREGAVEALRRGLGTRSVAHWWLLLWAFESTVFRC